MSKRRWTCNQVERIFSQITDTEMRQRLAETLELLLMSPSQLQRPKAFSSHSFEITPRLKHKRKGHL